MAKIKEAGRPPGATNKGLNHQRTGKAQFRCTEGYQETITALKKQDPAGKLSEADIIHEALQRYAFSKLSKKVDIYWVNRII